MSVHPLMSMFYPCSRTLRLLYICFNGFLICEFVIILSITCISQVPNDHLQDSRTKQQVLPKCYFCFAFCPIQSVPTERKLQSSLGSDWELEVEEGNVWGIEDTSIDWRWIRVSWSDDRWGGEWEVKGDFQVSLLQHLGGQRVPFTAWTPLEEGRVMEEALERARETVSVDWGCWIWDVCELSLELVSVLLDMCPGLGISIA